MPEQARALTRAPPRNEAARERAAARSPALRSPSHTGPPAIRLRPREPPAPPAGLPAPAAALLRAPGRGVELAPDLSARLARTLSLDVSAVRVHADERSRQAVTALGARAVAYGSHVFLGPGERADDVDLLAHEVAHVVQQEGAPAVQFYGGAPDAYEREAAATSQAVREGQHAPVLLRTPAARIQRQEPSLAQRALGRLTGLASAGADWVRDRAMRLVERYAPDLVPILRQGPVEWLKGQVLSAVQSVFDTLMAPVRAVQGTVRVVTEHVAQLVVWMRDAGARLARGDCGGIVEAAQRIQSVAEGLAAPVIDRVKAVAQRVGDFFSGLWERFGAPIWEFMRRIGGEVWDRIRAFGENLWARTQPIRDALSAAWSWVKDRLGIGETPEGQNGLLQWVQRKAGEAWDWVQARIAPYRRQLTIVAGVLVALSPAGPVLAIGAGIYGLVTGVRWLAQRFGRPGAVVEERGTLEHSIIPGIQRVIGQVTGALQRAAGALAQRLNNVVGGLGSAIGSLAGSVLRFAVSAAEWLLERFRALAAWAVEGVQGLAALFTRGLERLRAFLQPVFAVLRRVGRVLENVVEVVALVADRAWRAIPACVRDPFVNFLVNQILRRIPFFARLLEIPDVWTRIRTMATQVIRAVFQGGSLTEAAITVFRFLLDLLRVPIDLVQSIWAKGRAALSTILGNPIGFLRTLVRALGQALEQFGRRIGTHLLSGVGGWLFGQLARAGIQPPQDFSFGSILRLVLAVLGITADRVFAILERKIGRPVVQKLRQAVRLLSGAWQFVQAFLERGVAGLVDHLRTQVGNIWGQVQDAVIKWISRRIVVQALARLAAYLVPTGVNQVVGAIVTVYNAIESAVEYLRELLEMIDSFLDMVTELAAGVVGTAADRLEGLLARALPVAIGFLANQVGLGGVGDRMREMIEGLQQRVERGIESLIDRALAAGRSLLATLGIGSRPQPGAPGAPDGQRLPEVEFDEEDTQVHHKLWWRENAPGSFSLVMSSANTQAIKDAIAIVKGRLKNKPAGASKTRKESAISDADKELKEVEKQEADSESTNATKATNARRKLYESQVRLAALVKRIIRRTTLAKGREKFRFEGQVGSYSTVEGIAGVGDEFEADHQPSYGVIEAAAETRDAGATGSLLFTGLRLRKVWVADRGSAALSINLAKVRHMEGRTYAARGSAVAAGALAKMLAAIAKKSSDPAKRAAVIAIVRDSGEDDADFMENNVISKKASHDVWSDIHDLDLEDAEEAALISDIRAQVRSGLANVQYQDYTHLSEP